jgi:hypothetical protein
LPTPSVTHWAGLLSLVAAGLVVLSQVLRLVVGLMLGSGSATTVAHTLTYSLALLSMYALILALTAVYASESAALGRLGLLGYAIALLGTLLVAGDWWFEAFVVPMIAKESPGVLDLAPGASLLAGAMATVAAYSIGWLMFALACLRTDTIPRPAAVLLVISALMGPLALSTPYQIPLALAIGWIGVALTRASRGRPTGTDDRTRTPPRRPMASPGRLTP